MVEQNLSIEEDIAYKMSMQMQQEIDKEILWGMLKGLGWTRVTLSSETAMTSATNIKEWLSVNCSGPYEKHRSDFIFEDSKDASMFILRWM
jgi:hypothetical protein